MGVIYRLSHDIFIFSRDKKKKKKSGMSSTSHRREERLYPLTFFRKWREHFVFSRGLELLGNRFLKNLHITEEDEYVKEHSLVEIPKYHWNAKEAKVLNFRPDTLDLAIQEGESEKFFFLKIETYLREKIHSVSCLTRSLLCLVF